MSEKTPPELTPEQQSLTITRDTLQASIEAREKITGRSPDFALGTETERTRLNEVEARLTEISPKTRTNSQS